MHLVYFESKFILWGLHFNELLPVLRYGFSVSSKDRISRSQLAIPKSLAYRLLS